MKRYNVVSSDRRIGTEMHADSDGRFVLYSDHLAAIAQALKGVKLDDVLKAYQAATTPEAIKSIDTQAGKLASEADKAIARQVRKDRLAKLKAEQAAEAPAKLFAEYEADMRAAETQEARDAVLAGAILNEEQFKDLEALWLELKS